MNNTEDEPTGGEFPSKVTYWIEGVGNLAVGSVGLIINIVALWILFRKQVRLFKKLPFQTRQGFNWVFEGDKTLLSQDKLCFYQSLKFL